MGILQSSESEDCRTPNLRFRGRKSKKSLSSIYDLRPRRSQNPPLSSIVGLEEWFEDRAEDGGVRFLRNRGFFEDGRRGSSIFRIRRTKIPRSLISEAGRMKNLPHLSLVPPEDPKKPSILFFFRPPLSNKSMQLLSAIRRSR